MNESKVNELKSIVEEVNKRAEDIIKEGIDLGHFEEVEDLKKLFCINKQFNVLLVELSKTDFKTPLVINLVRGLVSVLLATSMAFLNDNVLNELYQTITKMSTNLPNYTEETINGRGEDIIKEFEL